MSSLCGFSNTIIPFLCIWKGFPFNPISAEMRGKDGLVWRLSWRAVSDVRCLFTKGGGVIVELSSHWKVVDMVD